MDEGKWMDGWTSGWLNGWMNDGCMDEWVDGLISGWKDEPNEIERVHGHLLCIRNLRTRRK